MKAGAEQGVDGRRPEEERRKETENGEPVTEPTPLPEEVKPTEETVKLPEKWEGILFNEFFEKGFKPKKRRMKGREYITLRFGDNERYIGRFTNDRWDLIQTMYQNFLDNAAAEETENEAEFSGDGETLQQAREDMQRLYLTSIPDTPKGPKSVLGIKLQRPTVIPTSITPAYDTIQYYRLMRSEGYPGSFEDFVNETVKAYFMKEGIYPVIMVEERVLK